MCRNLVEDIDLSIIHEIEIFKQSYLDLKKQDVFLESNRILIIQVKGYELLFQAFDK